MANPGFINIFRVFQAIQRPEAPHGSTKFGTGPSFTGNPISSEQTVPPNADAISSCSM